MNAFEWGRRACLAIMISALAGGCCGDRHRKVGAEEFQRLLATPIGSMNYHEYIGATSERAYLRVWELRTIHGAGDHVYSVAICELPEELRRRNASGERLTRPLVPPAPLVLPR